MKKILTMLLIVTVLLASVSALADSVKAVANPTYVRTGPGLDYKIVDSLAPNTYHEWGGDVVYDNRGVAWYSVYYGPYGTFGWVSSLHANMVSNQHYGNEDARNGAYSNCTSVYATSDVNVRTGPGTGYDSIGIVNKGSYLTYKGVSQYGSDGYTWYNVDFHGQNGWVSAKYGSLSDNGGITTYGAGGYGGSSDGGYSGSFAYGSGVYITGKCNIRSGPSLSHNSIGGANKGDVLTGTGNISTDSRGIAWYSVLYKGNPGWVSSVYASITGSTSSSSSGISSSRR